MKSRDTVCSMLKMMENMEEFELEEEKLKDVTGGTEDEETSGPQFQCFVCKAVFPATPGNAKFCPYCRSKFVDPYEE